MLSSFRSLMVAISKAICALGLGGVILWHVAVHSDARKGTAIVHVSAPDVDVVVDDVAYHVETMWDSPVVCQLRPGSHKLRMIRDARVVYEESFTLGAGEDRVLAAGDRFAEAPLVGARPTVSVNSRRPACRRGQTRP
jgi:hypothetical protein